MPQFRFNEVAAGTRVVEANRVVSDGANIHFERYVDGKWRTELSVPTEMVDCLRCRSGPEQQWVPVRPQPVFE